MLIFYSALNIQGLLNNADISIPALTYLIFTASRELIYLTQGGNMKIFLFSLLIDFFKLSY